MNYIYDILVNFKEEVYDFFDWNYSDNIEHIRKIPIIRVDSKSFYDIKHNYVKFNDVLLNKIKDKTEVFDSRKVKILKYALLLTNGTEVMGVNLDDSGNNKYVSNLLVDEESEVIEICEKLKEEIIDFKIIKTKQIDEFITRNERNIIKYIKKEIKLLDKQNDLDKLKYLYYECFERKTDNKSRIIKEINECLSNYNEKIFIKIYDFLKLTSLKK